MTETLEPLHLLSNDPETGDAACAMLRSAGWTCQVVHNAGECAQAPHCHWLEQLPAQQVQRRALPATAPSCRCVPSSVYSWKARCPKRWRARSSSFTTSLCVAWIKVRHG